jgi:hypothetical protein
VTRTLVQHLADFTVDTVLERLPDEVVHESKRLLLDSIGCAVAGTEELKGRAGIEYGRIVGGTDPSATVIGTPHKVSLQGAAFANAVNSCILGMGDSHRLCSHVASEVIPTALAVGERRRLSGREVMTARAKEGRPFTREDLHRAIMLGAVERVRPKMMTVAAITAGLLPILWSTGAGSEVMQRIAVPMIGGMVSSTLLTLIVIPAIYDLVKGFGLPRKGAAAHQPVLSQHSGPAAAE